MSYISFGDKDRERWGITEEWLEFDPRDISVVDLQELSERCAFDHTDWPTPFFGEIPFEQAGNPEAQRVAPRWQIQATVWMVLRQNGIPATWEDAGTARIGWMGWRDHKPGEEPEPESPGKGSRGTRSRQRAASTTRSSGTSSRRSPSKK